MRVIRIRPKIKVVTIFVSERKSAENKSNNRQLLSHPNQRIANRPDYLLTKPQIEIQRLRVTTAEEEVYSPKRDDRHILRDQI